MSVFALRYAHAFAQVASKANLNTDQVQQQMADFAATFDGSRELREVLMNPSIISEQKLRVLDAIAGRLHLLPQVRNFIAVIMEHQRLGNLHEILDEYAAVADQQTGTVEAEVVSARALGEDQRAELDAQVSRLAGGRVRTTYMEDPSLLGGVVVKIGATVYDGSLRAQLSALKEQLVTAQAS